MASYFERHRLDAFAGSTERMRQELDASSAHALLDIGGGTGAVVEAVAGGCPRVVVLEPHERRRRSGAKRRPQFEFVAGTAERIPFPDATFDRAIASVSLHHFHDVGAALAEIRRVLAPGGRLVIFEFDPRGKQGRFLHRFAGHVSLVTSEELAAKLRAAGFSAVETFASSPGYVLRGTRR
jgi:ubiquinone/menaquinone biosynthesis C-methylase UbiE